MASSSIGGHAQEVITVSDITNQILTNAEVIFLREKDLKVVSAQAQSGLSYYTSIVATNNKSASVNKDFKVVLNGPAKKDRRSSMMALLELTEQRVAKEILGK